MNTQESNPPRILFVDDEPNVLSAMQRLFYEEPYEVLTASGGAETLELLQKTGPVQLIISDYRMPVMTGVELLQKVMLIWPDTRRIILSGYTDSEILLDALNEGRVHRFLVKPWDNTVIKSVVREMLDEYEMLLTFRHEAEELALSNRLLSRTNEHLSAVLADVLANMRREIAHNDLPKQTSSNRILPDHKTFELLSSREREILFAIASGHSPKAIAMDLGISIKTVSTYKKRIFTKMGFSNDAELICYTIKNNLLPADLP